MPTDQELLAEIQQIRQQRRTVGPVAIRPSEQAELQSIRRELAAKRESQFLAENADFSEAADNPQEVGAGTRAVASLPITEQGKIDYLVQKFGPDNVKAGNGKIIVRDNGKWTNLNRDGLSWGDVAAMAGPAIEAIPSVAAGIATSGAGPLVAIPVAGAAGAAGNIIRQGVAKAATGEAIPSPARSSEPEIDLIQGGAVSERISQPFVSGVLGALGEGVVRAGAAGLRAMTPTARLERTVAKADPGVIKEGLELRQQSGSPMSLGEITQSDEIMRIEALQRQTPGAAGVVGALDDAKTKGLNAYARKIADEVAKGAAPRASEMGTALAEVRGQIRKTYTDKLRAQALADYAEVDRLSPGSSYLPTTNTQANIDKMIESKTTRFNTGAGQATIDKLQQAKADLNKAMGGALSPSEFQRSMEVWRKVAGTGQGVDLGLPRDETKEIGKTIMDGLYKDLDAAADVTAESSNPAAQALQTARQNYKAGKDAVEANDSDILKRAAIMVDKSQNAGKVVADIAAGRADTVQLGKTLAVLDANKPEAAAELRGSVLRTIYTPKRVAVDSPMVMLTKLDTEKNKAVTDALFAGDPQTQGKLAALKSLAKRYADNQKMMSGSPTAPRQVAAEALNVLPWIGPALRLVGHPIKTLSTLSDRMTSSAAMAQLTSTREGVDVLLGLMRPRTNITREVAKDIARLAARAIELTAETEAQQP